MMTEATRVSGQPGARLTLAVVTLGIALSAFFDGILLHQVLQWHHLLSLAEGATWQDVHNQILADGLFHVAVYIVTLAALAMLWRSRGELQRPGARRRVLADLLLGFGLWNVVDVVGFHGLAGIHRVRIDVPEPLPWDVGWLAVLGILPLFAGAWLRRRRGGQGDGGRAAAVISVTVLVAGATGWVPTASRAASVVIFRPDVSPNHAFAAVVAAGGTILDVSPSGRSMVVGLPDTAARWLLYSNGALLVGGGALAGCGTQR